MWGVWVKMSEVCWKVGIHGQIKVGIDDAIRILNLCLAWVGDVNWEKGLPRQSTLGITDIVGSQECHEQW